MKRIQIAALTLLALLLSVTALPQSFPPAPNMVIEANGAGLTRLKVRLLADGAKEPVQFELRGRDGVVSGGIALPKEGHAEYEITAYGEEGYVTHTGKGSIAGFVHNDRPVILPLHPTGEGDALVVALTRERIVLDVESSEPDDIAVRAHVFDPRGAPMEIKPGDLTWQLSDGRYINLIPQPEDFTAHLVPNGQLPTFELCDLEPQVSACATNHCKAVRVCTDQWMHISAGNAHTCALKQSGAAFCWGSNFQGELGAPTTAVWCTGNPTSNQKCSPRPLAVACPPGAPCTFTQISAGETLTAAVDTNGDVWWWGRGSPAHHKVNAVLNGVVKFSQVSAGFGHACAISQSRSEIWCWGTNAYGEAGAPRMTYSEVPDTAPYRVMVPFTFKRVAAGGEHTCAIGTSGNSVICWGRNDQSQSSGPNSIDVSPLPSLGPYWSQQFGGLVQILNLDLSPSATCVTLPSGVQCWGEYSYYNVSGFGTPDQLAVGSGHRCATTAQQAMCMGANVWGQLGIGTIAHQTSAVAVKTPPSLYSELAAGGTHTCGITPAGEAYCWGNNTSGQLGHGMLTWVAVKEPTRVVKP